MRHRARSEPGHGRNFTILGLARSVLEIANASMFTWRNGRPDRGEPKTRCGPDQARTSMTSLYIMLCRAI